MHQRHGDDVVARRLAATGGASHQHWKKKTRSLQDGSVGVN